MSHEQPTQPTSSTEQPLQARGSNRSQRPHSEAFRAFIAQGWQERTATLPARHPAAGPAQARRERLSRAFPGRRLVLPAGGLKTRSNDTDYRFRPHSAFSYYTGLGADREPDCALVLEPDGHQHTALLYFRPRAARDTEEFYADARYGELWVGARPTLDEVSAEFGIETRHLGELDQALAADAGADAVRVLVIPGSDPRIEALVEALDGYDEEQCAELAEFCSTARLVKDDWEVGELRAAIAASVTGFEEVVRRLPDAVAHARGERVIETSFESVARREGNGVGYDTIAAAGRHACTLHWIRNDGAVREGDLLLLDAGVERESLYTADITRTLPVSGTFTQAQRQVYQAVLDAADAAFQVARPGSKFRDLHAAAMQVLARRLADWGLLPVSAEESLDAQTGGQHRRWMVHGTSHHLGIDVHDCAQARREMYLDAVLEPGMVFTIEPGLYFMPEDLAAPEQLRGIGVRIEDNVLVTADGCENLTAALPRRPDEVEAWMRSVQCVRQSS